MQLRNFNPNLGYKLIYHQDMVVIVTFHRLYLQSFVTFNIGQGYSHKVCSKDFT